MASRDGGFANPGTTRPGPRLGQAQNRGNSAPGGTGKETQDAFKNADRINTTMHEAAGTVSIGKTAGVAGKQEPKAFGNSGTTKRGPTETNCATDVASDGWGGSGTRPRIRRARGSGFANVPTTAQSGGAAAKRPGHYDLPLTEKQDKTTGNYAAAGIGGKLSPVNKMRSRPSPSISPGQAKETKNAFHDVPGERHGTKWLAGARASMKAKGTEGAFTAAATRSGQSVAQHASSVLSNPNASTRDKRRANFAKMAQRGFKAQ